MRKSLYHERGVVYKEKGDLDQVISDYNKAIELNPKLAEAYYERGLAYFLKKEYDKTWEDVDKAEALGIAVDSGFLEELKKASGREN